MGLPKEKVMINIQRYGVGCWPLPLFMGLGKPVEKGDNIVLAAFGSGFTWGATLVKWAYNS